MNARGIVYVRPARRRVVAYLSPASARGMDGEAPRVAVVAHRARRLDSIIPMRALTTSFSRSPLKRRRRTAPTSRSTARPHHRVDGAGRLARGPRPVLAARGENTAGSDPSCDITLPARTAKRIGVFHVSRAGVSFDADPAAVVTTPGGNRVNAAKFTREETSIETSGVTIAVIRRGDKVGLRMWDPESPNRTQFRGLKYFPLDSAYHLRAKFVAYEKLKPVQVPNVLGQLVTMQSPGFVELRLREIYTLGGMKRQKHEDFSFRGSDEHDGHGQAGRASCTRRSRRTAPSIRLQLRLQPAVRVH